MPFGSSYIVKTIRLLAWEISVIDAACEALGGVERAQLMQEAVQAEAHRLGVRFSSEDPAPLRGAWPYLPERGETATDVRISISMRVTVAELMVRAAELVAASETLFIVGATLAYVGRLQACYRGAYAASEEDARAARTALRKVKLPPQYRYPPPRRGASAG